MYIELEKNSGFKLDSNIWFENCELKLQLNNKGKLYILFYLRKRNYLKAISRFLEEAKTI